MIIESIRLTRDHPREGLGGSTMVRKDKVIMRITIEADHGGGNVKECFEEAEFDAVKDESTIVAKLLTDLAKKIKPPSKRPNAE